jgi:hypothetical protein
LLRFTLTPPPAPLPSATRRQSCTSHQRQKKTTKSLVFQFHGNKNLRLVIFVLFFFPDDLLPNTTQNETTKTSKRFTKATATTAATTVAPTDKNIARGRQNQAESPALQFKAQTTSEDEYREHSITRNQSQQHGRMQEYQQHHIWL